MQDMTPDPFAIQQSEPTGAASAQRIAAAIEQSELRLAADITLAVEFLMTAQRAILRGFPLTDVEVSQPLTWAQLRMGWTPARESN